MNRNAIHLCLVLSLAACQSAAKTSITDRWQGRWTGPEGTFLLVEGQGGAYRLTIQSLDGPEYFAGRAENGHIAFQRRGRTETIRSGDGPATGMKWLRDKTDCLVIAPGEGFCRR